jgi:hypothetical protein
LRLGGDQLRGVLVIDEVVAYPVDKALDELVEHRFRLSLVGRQVEVFGIVRPKVVPLPLPAPFEEPFFTSRDLNMKILPCPTRA